MVPCLDGVDEQTRILPITSEDGQDLRKPLDQPTEYEASDAPAGPVNEKMVVPTPPPSNRGALMLYNALLLCPAPSPEDCQPQPAAIRARAVNKPSTSSLTERNVIKLRLEADPKLGITADTFCVTNFNFIFHSHRPQVAGTV
eukprot:CAMPEP_0198202656 /NCGR_PEP_ID=MMETSP1445-20131203/5863_1 /TAXON_ID=36898 /ORGANISM="Pyramimonas sp., Strain CCMP2087" /LENGTH=142 /DNA_ID=CAMNT_0043873691 /DNA_START=164 /DNA_END=592 /DNA_ORIENTATION=+